MTSCCQPSAKTSGTDAFFSRCSRRYLKRFTKRGLAKEQRALVEALRSLSIEGKTILDIGCGVGSVHLTLLANGASTATGLDISEGMLTAARRLSSDMGLQSRVAYLCGEFTSMEQQMSAADIVILDKVVCCYEDVESLVGKSLGKTKHFYALSFPRSNILTHVFFRTSILLAQILRWQFRPYWHHWDGIIRQIENAGFEEQYFSTTLMWDVRVFRKE